MKLLVENWQEYLEEEEVLMEKCWPGYEKKGMKTMFGKRYPNCVKKKKKKNEQIEERPLEAPEDHDYRKKVHEVKDFIDSLDFSLDEQEQLLEDLQKMFDLEGTPL